ncbi:Aspartyl protease family protein [Camellia lanceoleosa]|uniref:Aspartyl protease family protein n=1 Tax=Camellia lanceoleosa TaxID=1840588 RepID=A0ACC0FIP7_9ERIC|nr:Aspartyl protease family protein [Camellia lanceoleosa]
MMATQIASSISISFLSCVSLLLVLCFSKNGYALGGGERETLQSHFHTVQVNSLLPASVCSPSTKDKRKGASLKVVHKYGPCSHLHEHSKENAPTVTEILRRDQLRVNSIQSRLRQNSLKESKATTIPANSGRSIGTGNYIVRIGLGTPKKDFTIIFDTGSDFTWTQCQPCLGSCYQQQEPIYDPSLSSTYTNITCSSHQCSQLSSATNLPPRCFTNTCVYGIVYGDSSFSQGFFGSETVTLTPSDVFPNFLFGCGEKNDGLFGGAAGLIGLGRDPLSLVSQTSSKYGNYFSYCLPSTTSASGYLTFGNGGGSSTGSSLQFTPLLSNSKAPSLYFIDIIGIKVSGQTLSISQLVFKTAGSIIDSGTVITRLPPAAYDALKTAFRDQMKQYPMAQSTRLLDTCYDLSRYNSVKIPQISFLFGGNIELPLDTKGILYAINVSQVCLAFAGNMAASNLAIFGNVQQQTLDVVYDVAGGKLGFGSGGCS